MCVYVCVVCTCMWMPEDNLRFCFSGDVYLVFRDRVFSCSLSQLASEPRICLLRAELTKTHLQGRLWAFVWVWRSNWVLMPVCCTLYGLSCLLCLAVLGFIFIFSIWSFSCCLQSVFRVKNCKAVTHSFPFLHSLQDLLSLKKKMLTVCVCSPQRDRIWLNLAWPYKKQALSWGHWCPDG